MKIDPPEDHIIALAQVVELAVAPEKLKTETIHWKVDGKIDPHSLAELKVKKVLSVESWDPAQAKEFKERLFVLLPSTDGLIKVGSELKVFVTDARHYGWNTPREISTTTVAPFWVPPAKSK